MSARAFTEADWLGDATASPKPNPGGRPAKNYGARSNRKLACDRCGFSCRTSTAQIARVGAPSCACGAGPLTLVNFRDRLALDESSALDELGRMSADAARGLLRDERLDPRDFERYLAGATDRERSRVSHGGESQQRCSWEHSYCVRFASRGGLCDEHYAETHAGSDYGRAHVGVELVA